MYKDVPYELRQKIANRERKLQEFETIRLQLSLMEYGIGKSLVPFVLEAVMHPVAYPYAFESHVISGLLHRFENTISRSLWVMAIECAVNSGLIIRNQPVCSNDEPTFALAAVSLGPR
jgi:hypothetical protein